MKKMIGIGRAALEATQTESGTWFLALDATQPWFLISTNEDWLGGLMGYRERPVLPQLAQKKT